MKKIFLIFLLSYSLYGQVVSVTFHYRQQKASETSVRIAGDFNGWNTDDNSLMTFDPSDSTFKKTILLSTGDHQYLIYINTRSNWIYDPDNPNKGTDNSGFTYNTITVSDPMVTYITPAPGKKYSLISPPNINVIFAYTDTNPINVNAISFKLNNKNISLQGSNWNNTNKALTYKPSASEVIDGTNTINVGITTSKGNNIRTQTFELSTQPSLDTLLGMNNRYFFTFDVDIYGDHLTSANEGMLIDYDSDGLKDILISQIATPTYPATSMPIQLIHNEGSGKFKNVTSSILGDVEMVAPRDHIVADFNNDNLEDIVIADHGTDIQPFPGGQSRLLIQKPDKTLKDETSLRLPNISAFTHNVAVGDIDNDGYKEIYMCNIGDLNRNGPTIYHNDGKGIFKSEMTRIPGDIANLTKIFTASRFVDVDMDGNLDLVLGSSGNPDDNNLVLLNDGKGVFNYPSAEAFPPKYSDGNWITVSITPADFNNDGYDDLLLFITSNQPNFYKYFHIQLFINNGDGRFIDKSDNLPQSWNDGWIAWAIPVDMNSDGLIDFVTYGGSGNNNVQIFMNLGKATFINKTVELLPSNLQNISNTILPSDFNNDGLMDLFLLKDSKNAYYLQGREKIVVKDKIAILKLTNPTKNPTYNSGQSMDITWLAQNVSTINIDFSSDNGITWNTIKNNIDATLGQYQWTLPSNEITKGKIRIVNTTDPDIKYISPMFKVHSPTSVENKMIHIDFALSQNYPNPFNSTTLISYQIPEMNQVSLEIYDLLGREVASLVNEQKQPGKYKVNFDGNNLTSGVYFYRLQAGSFVETKKLVLIK